MFCFFSWINFDFLIIANYHFFYYMSNIALKNQYRKKGRQREQTSPVQRARPTLSVELFPGESDVVRLPGAGLGAVCVCGRGENHDLAFDQPELVVGTGNRRCAGHASMSSVGSRLLQLRGCDARNPLGRNHRRRCSDDARCQCDRKCNPHGCPLRSQAISVQMAGKNLMHGLTNIAY